MLSQRSAAGYCAIGELLEEVGITISADKLKQSMDEFHFGEHKRERLEIFELALQQEPKVKLDNREVVRASFYDPTEALELKQVPLLRMRVEQKMRG